MTRVVNSSKAGVNGWIRSASSSRCLMGVQWTWAKRQVTDQQGVAGLTGRRGPALLAAVRCGLYRWGAARGHERDDVAEQAAGAGQVASGIASVGNQATNRVIGPISIPGPRSRWMPGNSAMCSCKPLRLPAMWQVEHHSTPRRSASRPHQGDKHDPRARRPVSVPASTGEGAPPCRTVRLRSARSAGPGLPHSSCCSTLYGNHQSVTKPVYAHPPESDAVAPARTLASKTLAPRSLEAGGGQRKGGNHG